MLLNRGLGQPTALADAVAINSGRTAGSKRARLNNAGPPRAPHGAPFARSAQASAAHCVLGTPQLSCERTVATTRAGSTFVYSLHRLVALRAGWWADGGAVGHPTTVVESRSPTTQ